ncbi:diguanylate cyclase [Sulfuricurvum sp.]|uniref:ABC transporter substrate-binding protein n=1 Tax=Sulfuricurvum sp. TaxID=2025608 RepID=UPI00262D9A42|nr:diguanylate cyclase [Sulfuricurvum sp.]MDD2267372.1 diguanylate cyclase [Sulfuricurvum sp.]MDD2782716.1 diguanylate cyclase [Sulfuricurvum sp.]
MVKIIVSFLLFFTCIVHAESQSRIFILHSYSQEYGWTKYQHESFVSTLEHTYGSPLEFSVEYLDTKRHPFTESYQKEFVSYLQKKFEGYYPDAIYVTDDNALKFFIAHRSELFSNVPIFFSGINNLSLVHTLDKKSYTGVYESKNVVKNIELIRQFSPQTRDIWFVGDDSSTYKAIESDIRNQITQYPNYRFHFLSSPRIDDIVAKLPTAPKSFVLLTTIGGLCDATGRNLTLKESISTLEHNPHLILCSMEDTYVMDKVVGGFVTSGKQQGKSAAELVKRYLEGEAVERIDPVIKSPNIYVFDQKALMQARLILSEYIARDSVILHGKRTFFEQHQQAILNGTFILFGVFLLYIVISFFMMLQKNSHIKNIGSELKECSDELSQVKEKLALLEHPDE